MQRESMSYDLLIVGAGPAGLAAAIRAKQLAAEQGREIGVCVLEKGSEVGAHILSGAVIDPRGLDELLPDWRSQGAPLTTEVSEEQFLYLRENSAHAIPNALLPAAMRNEGKYTGSLGKLCRWLAEQAEALGVEIYPGFAGAELLYDEQGAVMGVATGDMGIGKDGQPKPEFARGMELHARYTLLGEGARGSLSREAERRYNLREHVEPPKYGIGYKELWRVDPTKHRPGKIVHALGWPLDNRTGGGGFLYHQEDNLVAVGLVVHLNYENPYLSPFEEFQRFKTHPAIRAVLEGGQRLVYGCRAITEGGVQSLPKLVFPGGALIGCAAGFVNVPRIKGVHNALKTGMLAAEAAVAAIAADRGQDELTAYPEAVRASWVWQDLYPVRNVKPALSRWGTALGTAYAGFDLWMHQLGLKLPWTLRHRHADHECLKPAAESRPITYPKPDGVISFDRLSSVYLSGVTHEEDQPSHLRLKDPQAAIDRNLARFDAPEQRYCPAGVYEIVRDADDKPQLLIHASNCLHCKSCDIKEPFQNITWTTPEGGGGPNYSGM